MKHSNWPEYNTPCPKGLVAKITNKRRHHNHNGTHICAVSCPDCGTTRGMSYGGWSAVACAGCDATLYRNRRSLEADNG